MQTRRVLVSYNYLQPKLRQHDFLLSYDARNKEPQHFRTQPQEDRFIHDVEYPKNRCRSKRDFSLV